MPQLFGTSIQLKAQMCLADKYQSKCDKEINDIEMETHMCGAPSIRKFDYIYLLCSLRSTL